MKNHMKGQGAASGGSELAWIFYLAYGIVLIGLVLFLSIFAVFAYCIISLRAKKKTIDFFDKIKIDTSWLAIYSGLIILISAVPSWVIFGLGRFDILFLSFYFAIFNVIFLLSIPLLVVLGIGSKIIKRIRGK